MSRSKKFFIAAIVVCSLMAAATVFFHYYIYRPRLEHYERVASFLARIDEHRRYKYEFEMVQIEYDANVKLLEMYDEELEHMMKLAHSFPSDDVLERSKKLEAERDEAGAKADYLKQRLDLSKSYIEGLDKYLALSCMDFGFSQEEADRVMTDRMSPAEARQLLISKGVIK